MIPVPEWTCGSPKSIAGRGLIFGLIGRQVDRGAAGHGGPLASAVAPTPGDATLDAQSPWSAQHGFGDSPARRANGRGESPAGRPANACSSCSCYCANRPGREPSRPPSNQNPDTATVIPNDCAARVLAKDTFRNSAATVLVPERDPCAWPRGEVE